MTAPYTRNWSANELPDLVGRNYHVEVKGEVETRSSNMVPKLRLHSPQGFNPRILLLDLTIESDGELGGQVVMLRKAAYTRPTSGNAYDEVDILFEGADHRTHQGRPSQDAGGGAQEEDGQENRQEIRRKAAKKSPAKKKKAKKKQRRKRKRKRPRGRRRKNSRPKAHADKFTQSAQ